MCCEQWRVFLDCVRPFASISVLGCVRLHPFLIFGCVRKLPFKQMLMPCMVQPVDTMHPGVQHAGVVDTVHMLQTGTGNL